MIVHLTAAEIADWPERRHQHQFNENAIRQTRTLGIAAGLTGVGLHLIRLEPGRTSTQHHWHDADEEFVYILGGRGIACLGHERIEVGPGDFMGFPAPSPAHSLENPFAEDLLYLVGGECNAVDLVHYPRIARTLIKSHGSRRWVDWRDIHELA